MNIKGMSDTAILSLIGDRMRRTRLNQNQTQLHVAQTAGVALKVIKRIEAGKGCTLTSFIKVLRMLGKIDQLDSFLPDPGVSPLELARLAGKERKGASGKRGRPKKPMQYH